MKKKKKYDIIIYISLIIALICIGLSAIDYTKSSKTGVMITNDKKEKEMEVIQLEEEPFELHNIDKNTIVKKYIDQVLDQAIKDDVISYPMIKTWGDYNILSNKYIKQIVDEYYEYETNIIIPNKEALLPCQINEELSYLKKKKDTYIVKLVI